MISAKVIEDVVYDLCVQANTTLNEDVFSKIVHAYEQETNAEAKNALALILKNAQMAQEKNMPLCQDTGQVLVFVSGKCFPEGLNNAINAGVTRAYEDNSFRKSVVKNAVFDRYNTRTNTPCIIYTDFCDSDDIEISLLIKGAGSENASSVKMLSPTASEDEIVEYVVSVVKSTGAGACPPYFIGVGIGGTMEYAGILSKKALLMDNHIDASHHVLADKIKHAINELNIGAAGLGGATTALDVRVLTDFTHIASMPVAVTINCHSFRHAKWRMGEQKTVNGKRDTFMSLRGNSLAIDEAIQKECNSLKVNSSDILTLKSLKQGQNILLSGELYTARDMAHKKLVEMIQNGEPLPFDLKNKVIFYAGPCPSSNSCDSCVVGSIGPTTASRMDKFAPILYKEGVLATIGKGDRSEDVKHAIKETGGLYLSAIGGIACYLSECFVKKELIAFEELGTEAIYRFKVVDLPLRVELN